MFVAETPEGVTAIVLIGDGTMVFQPGPNEERGQLQAVRGHRGARDAVHARRSCGSTRSNSSSALQRHAEPVTVDTRAFRRGLNVFDEEVPKSFNLDLSDLSRDIWSLLPQAGDFVAEVRTRRFDDLTYARSSGEAEDVTLFHRARKRNIAAYASRAEAESRGTLLQRRRQRRLRRPRLRHRCVVHPEREWMEGRTRMRLRVKSHRARRADVALAEALNVQSVTSDEFGRLLFLRVRNQNSVLVNLPVAGGARFRADARRRRIKAAMQSSQVDRSGVDRPFRSAQRATGRHCRSCRRAEVAVQQSQLLVSAEPGDRLRDGATFG